MADADEFGVEGELDETTETLAAARLKTYADVKKAATPRALRVRRTPAALPAIVARVSARQGIRRSRS